jgi:hypothetical protein
VLHLSILLAVLITLSLMQRSNEITAIKATGISIYRVVVPILVSTMLAAGLFFSISSIFPTPTAPGRVAQPDQGQAGADLSIDRKWIFGQHSTIYYYQFFSDRDQFGSLSAFQFDPQPSS